MNIRDDISTEHILWALFGLVLAMLPHAARFSPWMMISFVSLASWRVLGALGLLPLPDRDHLALWLLKHVLAIAAFLAIYVSYHGQLGRNAGLLLLTTLLGLKVVEMRAHRDFYVVSLLGYFLVVTNFFYSQTMAMAGYMLVAVIFITAGLIRFNASTHALSAVACVRLAGLMLLQSLPLMAIAFLLFPRIPGPLWGVPQDARGAVTGLTDEMTIGHISRLSLSDEIAFRAAFDGPIPRAVDRYWRGPVLWHTDGTTWRAGTIGDGHTTAVVRLGESFHYTVTLEPHDKRWLYGLEMVTYTGNRARSTSDLRLLARNPVKRRIRYTLVSSTRYAVTEITPEEKLAALRLPAEKHLQARRLANSWRETSRSQQGLITKALDYFNRESFRYTLTPRLLTGDSVDQFLFETREGFCEHYAAAFVVLMRAAGIPARVVTGYQGGEFNAVGDYLVIRQRDAHAWAEVYLDGSGWKRVDPTAAVAPGRVSLGIRDLLPNRNALAILGDNQTATAVWNKMREVWDAANYGWAQWVLGYSPQRQRQLLDTAGLIDWDYGTLITVLTLSLATITLILGWLVIRQKQADEDPITRTYGRFCKKLARIGIERHASEGPLDFARRVARARGDLDADVHAITQLYVQIRYAGNPIDPKRFSRRVKEFSPARRD